MPLAQAVAAPGSAGIRLLLASVLPCKLQALRTKVAARLLGVVPSNQTALETSVCYRRSPCIFYFLVWLFRSSKTPKFRVPSKA